LGLYYRASFIDSCEGRCNTNSYLFAGFFLDILNTAIVVFGPTDITMKAHSLLAFSGILLQAKAGAEWSVGQEVDTSSGSVSSILS
jgi:hypothetical protein